MYYSNYLIHYNKNHSSKNGQFVSGDGDGDGIANDHANRGEKKKGFSNTSKGRALKRGVIATAVVGGIATTAAVVQGIRIGKGFIDAQRDYTRIDPNTGYSKKMVNDYWNNFIKDLWKDYK